MTKRVSRELVPSIAIYGPSLILLLALSIMDTTFIINHLFALIFLVITFLKFNKQTIRKQVYLIILFTSIMGSALKIPLGNNPILSQLNVYYIYILIYFIFYIFDVVKKKEQINLREIIKRPLCIIGIMFMAFVYISILWAGSKSLAIKELVNYTAMFALCIVVIIENVTIEDRKLTKQMLSYIVIGILAYSTFKIVTGIEIEPRSIYTDREYFRDPSFDYVHRIPTVFFYNPNNYALVAGLILIGFFIALMKYNKLDIKLGLLFLGFVITEINLIFASSRTAWISMAISFVFMFLLYLVRRQWKRVIRTIVLCLVTAITFTVFYKLPGTEIYFGKVKNVVSLNTNIFGDKNRYIVSLNNVLVDNSGEESEFKGIVGGQQSDNIRLMMSLNSINYVFKEGHYLGAGVGNINEYNKAMGNTGETYDSHNFWAELLGDLGIVGFGLFFIMYVYCFIKNILRKPSSYGDLSLMFLVGCTFLVFGPSSVVGMAPLWIVYALIYSYTLKLNK